MSFNSGAGGLGLGSNSISLNDVWVKDVPWDAILASDSKTVK